MVIAKRIAFIQKTLKKITTKEINELVYNFSNRKLSAKNWTHNAHILVAIWHNYHYDFNTALDLMRSKIIKYNRSIGTVNSNSSGYHETLTVFWMLITRDFVEKESSYKLDELCYNFSQMNCSTAKYPLEYYTKDTLFSEKARKEWIDGDIKSLKKYINNGNTF